MNKNSMFYWWPLIKGLEIPKPKTILVPWKGKNSVDLIEAMADPTTHELLEGIRNAAKEIGYPFFLRSDETSNKHDWRDSCYVASEEEIPSHVANIVEMTLMAFGLGFQGFAVREFLDLDARFMSHNGMPVAVERRYFVRDGEVECWHPYWPPASVEEPSIPDWRQVLSEMQTSSGNEKGLLGFMARKIGKVLGGYWSIDFCRHRNRTWYVTDMALGEQSYHWATCRHAPREMFRLYGDPEAVKEDST